MAGQAGSSIGHKGLLTAARAITLSCIRTMQQPEKIALAKEETLARNGGRYVCPLPDSVQPPVGRY
jgi:aminobenzoyl-glutamate utilization protein B